jgi:hypothetical protein
MAEFKGEEFKFPDEIEDKGKPLETHNDDDFEIEVVDDTPPADRGRKPLDREVADPTDEEINQYTKGAQERIKELTHARHDERRAKEAMAREKAELERIAQQMLEENKRLKDVVNSGSEQFTQMAKTATEAQLEKARREYKIAQEAFDTDAIIAAQEALTIAKIRAEEAKNFRPTPLQIDKNELYSAPQQTQTAPDEKSLRWQAKNQWFGAQGFEDITSFALGLHQKLVNSGVDPRSEQYYEQIDARIKKTFPEMFGEATATTPSDTPTKKTPSVTAPAARSSGTKKIQLTTTQLALAKKFKMDPKVYAAEVLKLERQNG